MIILIRSNLPHPITRRRMIDQSRWIPAYIVSRLVHFKGTVGNSRKNISPDILQLQRADVDIIKIQKIRFLIVRMSGRISKINLILSIRHILGIRTGTCRLHYLIRPPVYLYLIILIGQRQAGNSRMPANPPPTQIDMLRIIRQDKRRRISGIIFVLITFSSPSVVMSPGVREIR